MLTFTKSFKYTTPFILYLLGYLAFSNTGIYCWIPLIYVFFFIPVLELFIAPDPKNLDAVEEQLAKANKWYDFIIWMTVPLQFISLYLFLTSFETTISNADIAGRIVTMGLLCGAFGINAAHELGHRTNNMEQFLAKLLLLTSLYMHFFIEHNKGHHKHVATPHDPSTAKYKQTVYAFWIQTFIGTYLSAWHIAIDESKKKNRSLPFLNNEMFLFQLIQIGFVLSIFSFFGFWSMLYFLGAALLGATLLETVNYIEHYGLTREKGTGTNYERVQPHHSWNSNHVIGRLMLFELSRHSDHHYLASRKYQILRNMEEAPQMPTGYPGMIVLSLFPPVWFSVMHRQMKKYAL
jgi:alkane 1-monooxygenase